MKRSSLARLRRVSDVAEDITSLTLRSALLIARYDADDAAAGTLNLLDDGVGDTFVSAAINEERRLFRLFFGQLLNSVRRAVTTAWAGNAKR